LDEKNGGPLSVLHMSKRGILRLGFQNLGKTVLGALLKTVVGYFLSVDDHPGLLIV